MSDLSDTNIACIAFSVIVLTFAIGHSVGFYRGAKHIVEKMIEDLQ